MIDLLEKNNHKHRRRGQKAKMRGTSYNTFHTVNGTGPDTLSIHLIAWFQTVKDKVRFCKYGISNY